MEEEPSRCRQQLSHGLLPGPISLLLLSGLRHFPVSGFVRGVQRVCRHAGIHRSKSQLVARSTYVVADTSSQSDVWSSLGCGWVE